MKTHPPFSLKYPLVATIYRLEHFPHNPWPEEITPTSAIFRKYDTQRGHHRGTEQNLWVLLNSALLPGNMGAVPHHLYNLWARNKYVG